MSTVPIGSCLVSGASGLIGRRLLACLTEGGIVAHGLYRQPNSAFHARFGDLSDQNALLAACQGMQTVFHCAGYAHAFATKSRSGVEQHWRVNFEGTRNLIEAANKAGVQRFVFLSSVKAMAEPGDRCVDEAQSGEPTTPYGKAKRAAEEAVLEAGAKYSIHVVNLRLAMVYGRGGRGNLERMVQAIRVGWFPPLPETGNRRSLIHVDDVVAAMHLVARQPEANGQTYIVADPRAYSGREIYDTIRAALGMPFVRWRMPARLLRAGGWIGDGLGKLMHRPLPLNYEVVSRLLDSGCFSPTRIEQEVGFRARIGLEVGLRELLS